MTPPNRQQRRNAQRAAAGRAAAARARQPAGDGMVFTGTGEHYEARGFRELPDKVTGEHRWVAVGSWSLNLDQARTAYDPDAAKSYLDHENMLGLGIGCWDCERTLGEVPARSVCPAPAAP